MEMRASTDVTRLVRALALPTFGLALAMSVLTTYAPVLLGKATDSGAAIGLAIGAEGAFALVLPLLVGSLSDRTRSRLGRRLPYALFAAPLLVAPLVLLPFSSSYAGTVALVSLFFVGYFVYYPPYQALFADLVPASHHGRAQGAQAVMRGLGLGGALVGGGLLLSVWAPLPFLVGAAAIILTTLTLVRTVRRSEDADVRARVESPRPRLRALVGARGDLRTFLVANALWEFSFMGLKTFIVLFMIEGLGESIGTATAVIGVVAGAYVLAAVVSGRLADRFGIARVLRVAIWVYGAGLLFAATLDATGPMLVGLPFVALAGAVLMTLPYGLLMKLTPAGAEGSASGLFNMSRAVGVVLGPIAVGVAIDVLEPLFGSTNGYGAMWVVVGVPIILSLAFVPSLRDSEPAAAASRTDAEGIPVSA